MEILFVHSVVNSANVILIPCKKNMAAVMVTLCDGFSERFAHALIQCTVCPGSSYPT